METNSLIPLLPRETDKQDEKKMSFMGVGNRDLTGAGLLLGDGSG